MTTQTFYRTVTETSHQEDPALVRRATAAVLRALRDRLTMNEADQLLAQLPEDLQEVWAAGEAVERRPVKMDRDDFYRRVMREAGLPSQRDARGMVLAVFAALKQQISPGEADDVLAQLPRDLKEVWTEARSQA